jgi:hypothetical protein
MNANLERVVIVKTYSHILSGQECVHHCELPRYAKQSKVAWNSDVLPNK